jgi:hypothetical protein
VKETEQDNMLEAWLNIVRLEGTKSEKAVQAYNAYLRSLHGMKLVELADTLKLANERAMLIEKANKK